MQTGGVGGGLELTILEVRWGGGKGVVGETGGGNRLELTTRG